MGFGDTTSLHRVSRVLDPRHGATAVHLPPATTRNRTGSVAAARYTASGFRSAETGGAAEACSAAERASSTGRRTAPEALAITYNEGRRAHDYKRTGRRRSRN